MIKENTIIHGNAKYIVRFGEIRIGLPGQQPVKFLKYVPEFRTYEDVRRFWSYPNHAKLEVKTKTIYDVKEV